MSASQWSRAAEEHLTVASRRLREVKEPASAADVAAAIGVGYALLSIYGQIKEGQERVAAAAQQSDSTENSLRTVAENLAEINRHVDKTDDALAKIATETERALGNIARAIEESGRR